jgi:hypothetical protein
MDEREEIVAGLRFTPEGATGDLASNSGQRLSDEGKTSTVSDRGALSSHLFLEQYRSLRDEIDRRVDSRQQILYLTLLAASTFLAFGVQMGTSYLVLLFYPVLALFLAALWSHNDLRIGQINYFIRTELEMHLGDLPKWEAYRRRSFRSLRKRDRDPNEVSVSMLAPPIGLIAFSTRGVFLTTQALALVIVSARYYFQVLGDGAPVGLLHVLQQGISATPGDVRQSLLAVGEALLVMIDVIVMVYTAYLVKHRRG